MASEIEQVRGETKKVGLRAFVFLPLKNGPHVLCPPHEREGRFRVVTLHPDPILWPGC